MNTVNQTGKLKLTGPNLTRQNEKKRAGSGDRVGLRNWNWKGIGPISKPRPPAKFWSMDRWMESFHFPPLNSMGQKKRDIEWELKCFQILCLLLNDNQAQV